MFDWIARLARRFWLILIRKLRLSDGIHEVHTASGILAKIELNRQKSISFEDCMDFWLIKDHQDLQNNLHRQADLKIKNIQISPPLVVLSPHPNSTPAHGVQPIISHFPVKLNKSLDKSNYLDSLSSLISHRTTGIALRCRDNRS